MSEDREAFYDNEIAPALAELGMKCQARGFTFLALVEWLPGEVGASIAVAADASFGTRLAQFAMGCRGNVDQLIFAIMNHARLHGHSSICLAQLGVPVSPGAPAQEASHGGRPN